MPSKQPPRKPNAIPLVCPCGKQFFTIGAMNAHITKEHGRK